MGHSRISTGGADEIAAERSLQKLRPFAHDPEESSRSAQIRRSASMRKQPFNAAAKSLKIGYLL